ncbi:glycosyltransferase [Clostridium sp. ATCC 25772]|uniref:glycosyltransferase n=1 Tax=Clostridium sp. ATCC 25772 TaxID=1676991 RepID=UPI000785EF24|nr:glycosyltransferase [Clostridium sp. ATCC 25772]
MQKKCIVHLPFYINTEHPSGSQIRPVKIINAFKEIGYDVEIISGYGKERKTKISIVKNNIKNGMKYDFVYSESSTEPTLLTEQHHLPVYPTLDFEFLKFCKKNNLKVGLFYRDIYWKFPIYKESVGLLKRTFASFFYKYDLKKYNNILDILYLPSMEMKKYIYEIKNLNVKELPPAIDLKKDINVKNSIEDNSLTIFYVGGITGLYDLEKLFLAVSKCKNVKLIVCCRENEWKKSKDKYEQYLTGNIEIIHKSGNELESYYKKSDIASLFFEPSEYRSFAMPLKLFEYMQYEKPIIATNGTATAKFVEKYDIGWNIDYNVEDLIELLNNIGNNNIEISNKVKNISNILEDNTWKARALQVSRDLQ